jgi:glycosyltransferase involved in cell wall biosynthesis
MKITHLTPFLQDSAGRVITDLAVGQREMGHQVTVVASRTGVSGYANGQAHLDRLDASGVTTYLADSLFVRDYAANLSVVRLLGDVVGQHDGPDVVHAHGIVAGLIGLMFAGRRRRPMGLLQTMHAWNVTKTAGQSAADVHVLNLMDRVATSSAYAAEILRGLGVAGGHLRVVPHGVGELEIEPDSRDRAVIDDMRKARKRGALVFACVGPGGSQNNQTLLVDAVARFKQMAGAAPCYGVFAGNGAAEGLSERIQSQGLAGQLAVRGFTRAARAIAAEADVLVVPSPNDGQPMEVLEAFCDRTLVMVSDTPELSELVTDGITGCRFAEGNVESLARVLRALAERSAADRQAVVERARRRYEQSHTLRGMLDAYDAEYQIVAPEARSRPPRRHLRAVND